jgi:hypothetical protein
LDALSLMGEPVLGLAASGWWERVRFAHVKYWDFSLEHSFGNYVIRFFVVVVVVFLWWIFLFVFHGPEIISF